MEIEQPSGRSACINFCPRRQQLQERYDAIRQGADTLTELALADEPNEWHVAFFMGQDVIADADLDSFGIYQGFQFMEDEERTGLLDSVKQQIERLPEEDHRKFLAASRVAASDIIENRFAPGWRAERSKAVMLALSCATGPLIISLKGQESEDVADGTYAVCGQTFKKEAVPLSSENHDNLSELIDYDRTVDEMTAILEQSPSAARNALHELYVRFVGPIDTEQTSSDQ